MNERATFFIALTLALSLAACSSPPDENPSTNSSTTNSSNMSNGGEPDAGASRDGGGADTGTDAGSVDEDAGGAEDAGAADMGAGDAGGGTEDTGPTACQESPNGDFTPTTTCQHGGADWLAWKWVPAADITVESIAIHTDEGFGALFADDNGKPGAVLFEGTLSAADADGWRTFEPSTPVELTGGATYWIGEDVLVCSVTSDGTEWEYFTSNSTAGPWSGPFMAHNFTARIDGTCP